MARRDQHRELRRSRALETIGFWILTLIVCAVAGAVCHRLGKAYLAEEPSRRAAASPAGPRPDDPVAPSDDGLGSEAAREKQPVIEVRAPSTVPDAGDAFGARGDKADQASRDDSAAAGLTEAGNPAAATGADGARRGGRAEPQAARREATRPPEQDEPAPRETVPVVPAGGRYAVRAGSFTDPANAQRVAADLRERGYLPQVASFTKDGKTYDRVTVGSYNTEGEASEVRDILRQEGFSAAQVTRE